MNKSEKLIEFCNKIGIFALHDGCITFGAYGHLILAQIKKEWLRASLYKFKNSLLVESFDLLDPKSKFDFNFYMQSLNRLPRLNKQLPLSLVNVHSSSIVKNKPLLTSDFFIQKEKNASFLTNNYKLNANSLVYLNSIHFFDEKKSKIRTENNSRIDDPIGFWQRERKNWWMKILSFPEYVMVKSESPVYLSDKLSNTYNLYYKLVEDMTDTIENEQETINSLERITHFYDLNNQREFLNQILNGLEKNNYLMNETKQIIVTQTTTWHILENILFDSVQVRRKKSEILGKSFKSEEKDKIVFRLDYRLAPIKACILFKPETNSNHNIEENLANLAYDLRKQLFYSQINVSLEPIESESDLDKKYNDLDEIGIPYSIYLPSTITKDGICFVRNRETTLQEHLHVNNLIKQFCSISNALTF